MRTKLMKTLVPLLLVIALAVGAMACSSAATTTTTSATVPATTTTTTTTTPTVTAPAATTTSSPAVTPTVTAPTTTAPTPTTTTNTTTLDEAAVRAFADPIVTSMMQGLSSGNYTQYIAHADAVFKAALTQDKFQTMVASLKKQIGTFQSAVYQSWEMTQGYIVVHYKATYSGGTVGVKLVFDSDHLVAGQFFE